YGNLITQSNSSFDSRYGFTGREFDEETKNVYFRRRYYLPQVGRLGSIDPLGFKGSGLNLYEYAYSNPLIYIDPSGLEVVGFFNTSQGRIRIEDLDTGEVFDERGFFSGQGASINQSEDEAVPNEGPIPRGLYEILYHPVEQFYRLDMHDSHPRNDRIDDGPGSGRNQFRLHYPGGSLGCITLLDNQENWQKWLRLNRLIRNTSTVLVSDNLSRRNPFSDPENILKYGEIRVTG
ncbi:MAG: RHS repeat-associated core domain-containing protein, partial [Bacteroidota bacterium]